MQNIVLGANNVLDQLPRDGLITIFNMTYKKQIYTVLYISTRN